MSNFLQQMAESSAERASRIGPIDPADLDRPVVPLRLSAFDVIAEIKGRSPAEGELAGAASIARNRRGNTRLAAPVRFRC